MQHAYHITIEINQAQSMKWIYDHWGKKAGKETKILAILTPH